MTRRGLFMVTAAIALMTSRAAADEHHMRVSEVFLSDPDQGDAVQFVELVDPVAEEFPAEYRLAIHDAAGARIGTVPVDPPADTRRYLVATAAAEAAFGVAADAPLSEALPDAAGQVCFEAIEDGASETIACLAYGCVDRMVDAEFANDLSMAPLAGMSVQRQEGSDLFEMAEPTPGRENVAGVAGQADCTPPDQEEDDGGGCSLVTNRSPGGLALVGLGLLAVRRRRRRRTGA